MVYTFYMYSCCFAIWCSFRELRTVANLSLTPLNKMEGQKLQIDWGHSRPFPPNGGIDLKKKEATTEVCVASLRCQSTDSRDGLVDRSPLDCRGRPY